MIDRPDRAGDEHLPGAAANLAAAIYALRAASPDVEAARDARLRTMAHVAASWLLELTRHLEGTDPLELQRTAGDRRPDSHLWDESV